MSENKFQSFFETDNQEKFESWQFSEKLASLLYRRFNEENDFLTWPDPVKIYYACYDMNFQVGSGGFEQAAFNIPSLFKWAAIGYNELGLEKYAQVLIKVTESVSKEKQNPEIDLSEYDYVTEEEEWWLGENLNNYARSHSEQFISLG